MDFDAPGPAEPLDLFRGAFKRSSKAKWIYSFPQAEFDVANAVKWAIENAARIHCLHRDRDLLAEGTSSTTKRLEGIAEHIARSFRELIAKLSGVNGASAADRGAFVMGLYDGMMNEPRNMGQPLPSRPGLKRRLRGKKRSATQATNPATNLHVHPYTLAVGLGRQIRFSVPLDQITAELESRTRQGLANGA